MGVSPRTGDAHKGLCYKDLGAFLRFCPNAPADHVIICGFIPESPEAVSERVKLDGQVVIMLRHPGTFDEMAQAWVAAGCRAVIRPAEEIDQNADLMFVLAFYYYLLAHDLPDHGRALTEREAFEKARSFDTGKEGTKAFCMLEREG